MLSYIIPFLILILVVVFIHEYGHYYFARKYGVGVTDFSIGFGKELFGWNDKHGTRWKVCAIPLGGYVKFFVHPSMHIRPPLSCASTDISIVFIPSNLHNLTCHCIRTRFPISG